MQPTLSNVSVVLSSTAASMHSLGGRLRVLHDLLLVGAQLGCLRSAMETSPWSDGVESSAVSMLRRSWVQQRPASSADKKNGASKAMSLGLFERVISCHI